MFIITPIRKRPDRERLGREKAFPDNGIIADYQQNKKRIQVFIGLIKRSFVETDDRLLRPCI